MTPPLLNNRYRIIKALGAGGFGDTYLAEDTQMPSARKCVIKQLKPITTNPQIYELVQQRFQREAAILEQLGEGCDRIPRLYAYFASTEQFYLVQQWIEGETLTQRVQPSGVMSAVAVRDLLVHLLPILDYVHSHRIVHRDIKPDNIILRASDGKPVLIDFGAVKEAMGTVVTSGGDARSSIVIGTPGFMPSEQAAGRPLYSSDLYSLGLTAIYALTGKRPQELEMNPTTGEIIWQQYAPGVDPQLVAVLNRAVQPYPRDRFPTAAAMLEVLQAPSTPSYQPTLAVAPPARGVGEQVNPQANTNYAPASQQPSGRKNVVLGSAIAGGLVGVSIVIGLVLSRHLQPTSPTATSTPILTGENPTDSPTTDIATTPIANTPAASPSPTRSIAPSPNPSRPTPPRLSQVLPSYIPNTFSPIDAFTSCPQSSQLYLVGETANFNFAVCGANGNPQYYIGKHKVTNNGITVSWNGSEFRNSDIVYSPPEYEGTDYEGLELTVDQGDKQLVREDVIRLYKLEE
jgi:serine/threonine protein kinase, bacterial